MRFGRYFLIDSILICLILLILLFLSSDTFAFQAVVEPATSARYQRFVDDLFEKFDRNADGLIQAEEHEQLYFPLLQFADSNKDHQVSKDEVFAVLDSNLQATLRDNWIQQSNAARDELQEAILNVVAPSQSAVSTVVDQQSSPVADSLREIDVSFVALELTKEIANQEQVTIKDLAKVITSEKFDQKELARNGIRLLQLYESSTVDSQECHWEFGYPEQFENPNFYPASSRNAQGFGTSMKVTPRVSGNKVLLSMEFNAILSNENDLKMRKIGAQYTLVFGRKSPAKIINLYSEGAHYLFIVHAAVVN